MPRAFQRAKTRSSILPLETSGAWLSKTGEKAGGESAAESAVAKAPRSRNRFIFGNPPGRPAAEPSAVRDIASVHLVLTHFRW